MKNRKLTLRVNLGGCLVIVLAGVVLLAIAINQVHGALKALGLRPCG